MPKKKKSKLKEQVVSNKGTEELVALRSKHASELAKFETMAAKQLRTAGPSVQIAGIMCLSSGSLTERQSAASSQIALPTHVQWQTMKSLDKQRKVLMAKHAKAVAEMESQYS